MGSLLNLALTPSNLDIAWRRLKSDRSRWDSTTSRSELEQHLMLHFCTLVDQLKAGSYRPGSMRQFSIAKTNGSQRVLSALYLRDKLAQRAILQVIEPIAEAEFDDDSYGYRPGRSVDMAIKRSLERIDCGLPWVVDADLNSFFDTIPHTLLLKVLSRKIADKEIIQLMNDWLKQSITKTHLFGNRKGIAQGAVLSPIECNYFLNELDQFWRKKGIPFVRFADDFLLFTPSEKAAKRAFEMTQKKLTSMNIQFNTDKTRILKASSDLAFLGQRLRGPKGTWK